MCSQSCKVHVWLMKKHACGWGSRLLDHIFGYNIMLILDVPCFKNKQLYLAWLSKAQAFQLHDLAKKHQKQKRKGRSFTSPQTKRTKSAGSGILTNINLALLVQSCPQNLDAPWQLRTTLDNMDTLPQEVCFDSLDVPMSLSKTVTISYFLLGCSIPSATHITYTSIAVSYMSRSRFGTLPENKDSDEEFEDILWGVHTVTAS